MSSKLKIPVLQFRIKNYTKPSWSGLEPVTGYPKFLTEFLATLMHFGIKRSKTKIKTIRSSNFITANFKVKNYGLQFADP